MNSPSWTVFIFCTGMSMYLQSSRSFVWTFIFMFILLSQLTEQSQLPAGDLSSSSSANYQQLCYIIFKNVNKNVK